MKILIVIGTRPNFIKIAPFLDEVKKEKKIQRVMVHTGQHYDFEMSKSFFEDLKIPNPDYNLGVGSGSHGWQTGETMKKLEPVVSKEKPDLIIVLGDVNATLAGALTAVKNHFPIAHIEAGLRSYDKGMPEEVNRVLTDHISDFLFCPTETSVSNLKREGIEKRVFNVGDIMYDAFLRNSRIAQEKSSILEQLEIREKNFFLLTLHRSRNVDNLERFERIIRAIGKSRELILFPVHPRTKKTLDSIKMGFRNVKIIGPVGYLDMLILEKNAKKILTDSGGVQKEAYWAKTPCITLREKTEWVETIESGWNILVGDDKEKITQAIGSFNPKNEQPDYFGQGNTSKKIINIIKR